MEAICYIERVMSFSAILILFLKTFSVQKRKTNTEQILFECKTTFVNFIFSSMVFCHFSLGQVHLHHSSAVAQR